MTEQTKPATKRPRRMAREPQIVPPAAEGMTVPSLTDEAVSPPPLPAAKAKQPGKTDAVIALLGREEGATLAELIAATGWLAHSTRAALTGLRKKGHVIIKCKRDEVTCYRIGSAH